MAVMVSSRRGPVLDATMHGVRRDVGALEGITAVDGAVGRREQAIDGASKPATRAQFAFCAGTCSDERHSLALCSRCLLTRTSTRRGRWRRPRYPVSMSSSMAVA